MYTTTNILIFGQIKECEEAILFLKQNIESEKRTFHYFMSHDYEEPYQQIVDTVPSLVIVIADGANGMECVYQAKKYNSNLPVFWFSDDRNFSNQSHRLECEYFASKPLTADKLDNAFVHCENLGIFV